MPVVAQHTQPDYLSEQDYLEREKHSDIRHEYVDGQVYAMAGTTKRHNEIAVNISTALRVASRGSLCKVYSSDVKVRAIGRKTFYYPDVLVGCEPDEADDYYLENPCLIVEVLSDSTEKRDRSEKLLVYMNIPTLRTYLLVAQDKPEVEMFYREPDGSWWVQTFSGLEASMTLFCPETTLTLAEVYDGITFTTTNVGSC
jgi:Uma2 family endonuclease